MDDLFTGRVAVIGLGYIGLPTAVALATRGIEVVGVDVNEDTSTRSPTARCRFVEPDLADRRERRGRIGPPHGHHETPEADAFIIAVPTPFHDDHTADLSYVDGAVAIAPRLRGGELVVLESTSPPGTTEQVSEWLAELRPGPLPRAPPEGCPTSSSRTAPNASCRAAS